MKTPDLPGSFIAAIAGNVVAVAVAFGAPLTGDQQKSLLALAVTLGSVITLAGAWLHGKRAENVTAITAAKAAMPVPAAFVIGSTSSGTAGHSVTVTPKTAAAVDAEAETDPAPATAAKPAARKSRAKKPGG